MIQAIVFFPLAFSRVCRGELRELHENADVFAGAGSELVAISVDSKHALRAWAEEGVPVVLATNQEHRRLAFLRERLGALLPITAVLASAELGVLKSDDRFWSLAAERVGVGVLLDDDLGNIEAARRCGCR